MMLSRILQNIIIGSPPYGAIRVVRHPVFSTATLLYKEDAPMSQQKRETRSQVPPFSGHSLLYTIYRHHHGLPHEQAVLRIDAAIQRSMAPYSHEDPPHTA